MITSNQNPLIKELQVLQKKKTERNNQKVFIVEGLRAVREIPSTWEIHQYVVAKSFAQEATQMRLSNEIPVTRVADSVFEAISDTKTPQGIMAVVSQLDDPLDQIIHEEAGFFIIADQVQDPGNLGTLIRTAHASGVSGIFLSKGCVDLYNPKTIRATMGSVFHIPIVLDMEMEEIINVLMGENTTIYATALEKSNILYDYDYTKKIAIVIGNEANGISETTKKMVSNFIQIPMPGGAESLNASIAAGICMFEVVRQRMEKKSF